MNYLGQKVRLENMPQPKKSSVQERKTSLRFIAHELDLVRRSVDIGSTEQLLGKQQFHHHALLHFAETAAAYSIEIIADQ
jgi:hypothetical protein